MNPLALWTSVRPLLLIFGLSLGTGMACHPGSAPLSSLLVQSNTQTAVSELQVPTALGPNKGIARADLPKEQNERNKLLNANQNISEPVSDISSKAQYVLMGIDCFGLKNQETCQRLRARTGLSVGQSLPLGWRGAGVLQSLEREGSYAYVGLSPVFYTDGTAYVTIDVVTRDEAQRLSMPEPPTQAVSVSSNLLELYGEYSNVWLRLFKQGIKVNADSKSGYWNSTHATLVPYISLFRANVPQHRQELINVATLEGDPTWRRAASGLLGFDTDDIQASRALSMVLLDPDHQVRSEAARALIPKLRKAQDAGESLISIDPVLRMLSLPSTSDRASAIEVLGEMVKIPALRKPILARAFPVLQQMLQASRPKASQSALQVLETATGLHHGRDVESWKKALEQL